MEYNYSQLLTPEQLMRNVQLANLDVKIRKVVVFFLSSKALTKEVEFSFRSKYLYFLPTNIIVFTSEGKRKHSTIGLAIKVSLTKTRQLKPEHPINALEIWGEKREFNGAQYYPTRIIYDAAFETISEKILKKHEQMPEFSFQLKVQSENTCDIDDSDFD